MSTASLVPNPGYHEEGLHPWSKHLKSCPHSFRHITSPCNVRQFLQQTRQPPILGGCLHTSVCQKPWMALGLSRTPSHFRLLCVSDCNCPSCPLIEHRELSDQYAVGGTIYRGSISSQLSCSRAKAVRVLPTLIVHPLIDRAHLERGHRADDFVILVDGPRRDRVGHITGERVELGNPDARSEPVRRGTFTTVPVRWGDIGQTQGYRRG